MMNLSTVFLGLLSLAPLGAAAEVRIDEQMVFSLRDSLHLLTPTPLKVSAALAADCVQHTPDALSEGARSGPHALATVNYYVSADGAAAMALQERTFPVGTVVVKEKLSPSDGSATAVGGMVKRPAGFDPANGDWEYFYADKSGGFEMGRLPNCVRCHAEAKASDFVYFRTSIETDW